MKVRPYPLWGRQFDNAQRCSVMCAVCGAVELFNYMKNIEKKCAGSAASDV